LVDRIKINVESSAKFVNPANRKSGRLRFTVKTFFFKGKYDLPVIDQRNTCIMRVRVDP